MAHFILRQPTGSHRWLYLMTDYQIIKATADHAFYVAVTMRQADVDEVWAANRLTP